MTDSHLSDNLALLAHESALLMRTAQGLDDRSVRATSLCEGWTRAHVLTHIARNADGLGNLVSWAVTGVPVAMYASSQARDADIAAGAARRTPEILTDLEESARRFASAAPGLAGPPESVELELRAGRTVLGAQLPTLRLMEVVFHHVDLDAGYTFEDADPGFVRRAVSNSIERFSGHDQAPSVTLRSTEGDTWSLTGGARDVTGSQEVTASQEVTGSNAALLLWLARGDGTGVSSEGALPGLPALG